MSAMDLFIGLNWKAVKGISQCYFATFSKMAMQLSPFLLCNFRYFYYATNNLYKSLSPSLQAIINPFFKNTKEYIDEWYKTPYEKSILSFSGPVYTSARKEPMRSKSEVFIAQILDKHHIPYLYEKPLYLEGYGTVYPDFTILDVNCFLHMPLLRSGI